MTHLLAFLAGALVALVVGALALTVWAGWQTRRANDAARRRYWNVGG